MTATAELQTAVRKSQELAQQVWNDLQAGRLDLAFNHAHDRTLVLDKALELFNGHGQHHIWGDGIRSALEMQRNVASLVDTIHRMLSRPENRREWSPLDWVDSISSALTGQWPGASQKAGENWEEFKFFPENPKISQEMTKFFQIFL